MAPDRPPLTIVQHLQLFDQILAGFETEDTQSPTTTSVGSATTYQAPNRPISLDQYAQLYKQVWDEFVTEDTQSPTTTSLGSATTYNASPYSKSFYSDSAELSAQPEISRIECFDDFESIYHDAPPVSASSYHHHHQSNGSYDSHDSHFIYTMSPISPGSSAPTTYARSTRSPSTRSNGRDRSGSERRLPLPPMRTLGPSSITSSTRKLPATPTSAPVSSGHERERVPLGVDLPANPRLRASPMRPRERNEQVGRSGPVDVPAYDWEYSSDNLDEHEYDSLEFANFSYLSHLAMHLRDIAPREVHMQGGIQYEKAFTGKDVVDTIQSLIKRHLLLNHSLNLTPFSYPSTAIDRKAALHVARSLQIQLWFFEVEGGGKELCDGVEDVYTFTDDSELPLAVVTMLTRCYVPTCFDDEPCYAWDCPKRGQSLHKMLAPPLLLLNNNSSTSFVPKVKSTAPLNTVKDLRGMQSYRDGENELSNVGVVDDGPSYNYDEYQRAATNESSSSSARRGRNQRIHRMVKLTATLQNTSTSHLISLSALIFTPHDSKVLVTAMEFAPTPYIKKLLESAFNLIGPLVYVKEVDFVLKHQPLVSALFSLVTVVINTYEDLHPPVEGINFLKSRRAEHGTSVGIQLPPRYQSSQPQSDLFSPDPALNRHVVEVIHMTKEIQTFIQKQGSRTFLQRFLDLSKSDKTMRDYTKRISQVLNAFLLQANITLESTISFSPAFLKTYYPTVNEISKQKLVDFLQLELDLRPHNDSDGTAAYYKRCMRDLSYLSANYQILPSSMIITDVTKDGRSPVNGGGFADIYHGKTGDQPVCLKVLRLIMEPDEQVRENIRKRFCNEALVWRQLKHRNILPLLGISAELFKPSFCIISPWMDNKDIITFLKRNPAHNRSQALLDVASGISYLHSMDPPIVHGDIRGGNILVADDLRCCIADFGLSLITADSQTWTIDMTSTLKGSMRWMAPELFHHDGSLDLTRNLNRPSRDIYAFGCTILEILTLQPPFYDRTDYMVLTALMAGERPARPNNVWYPDEIWDLTTRCWAQEATARPTVHEVYSASKTQSQLHLRISAKLGAS